MRDPLVLPRIYAILDAGAVGAAGVNLLHVAHGLHVAGIRLLQYRDKLADKEALLKNARAIAAEFAGDALLILNDSPELCVAAGWDGVHVGQGDGPVDRAREIVGAGRVVGVSTHDDTQVRAADASDADYIALGPIFRTDSKVDAEAEVGLGGITRARRLTGKPLVAIGGISQDRLRSVLDAGADTVAVIGALRAKGHSVEENARRLLTV